MKRNLGLVVLLLLFWVATSSWAAVTGKITGVMTDAQTEKPIVGVTISVEGTSLGAITDADGRYTILNVPVNTYVLKISSVGYSTLEVANVAVSADLATYQSHSLTPTTTELSETIRVTAETPLVIKDKVASINIIKRDEILAMPTRGFEELVSLQNSVVRINPNITTQPRGGRESINSAELNIRGGRPSEVAYYVDGFSQQDPLSGTSTANISNNAIKEVTVISGGFPAEYGHVSSGIVNVISNSGSDEYHGTVELVTDNYFEDLHKVFDQNYYSADFGGPIPGLEKGHFFVSGERRYLKDRNPTSLDGFYVLPNNSLDGWSYQGKLDYEFGPNTKLLLGANGSVDEWREYLHSYAFNIEHTPYYKDENLGVNGKITHTFNENTFANISGAFYQTKRFRGDGVHKEDLYAYGRPGGNPRFDRTNLFWQNDTSGTAITTDTLTTDGVVRTYITGGDEGHVYDDYYKRNSWYVGFKGDITSQIHDMHTVKFGFDYERHTLRYYRALFPVESYNGIDGGGFIDVDRYGFTYDGHRSDDESWENDTKNPINGAFYLQDRFEWNGMIVSAGLRFDYYDYKTERLKNNEQPLNPDSADVTDPNATILDPTDLEPSKTYTKLSPRLGISFPISDRTQIHVNYGKFFQRPNLLRLYVGYDFYEKMINRGGFYYAFGNPNLEPEKTTQYEFGFTHQLSDVAVFNFQAFYKDVTGLMQVYNQPAFPKSFASYRNSDYSTIKGLEFQIVMRRTNNIRMDLKYSLSYANGTGSYANTQSNVAWVNANEPKQTAPLSFDQRHSLLGVIDFRTTKGEGPKFGDYYPFENFGVNAVIQAASGTPYSPQTVFNEITMASTSPTPDGPRNSKYTPWTFNVDMKVERSFDINKYKVAAYFLVKNVFNRDNVYSVYESTGDPDNTGWLNTDAGQSWVNGTDGTEADATGFTGAEKYEIKSNNPQNYGTPRTILAGLRFSF